MGSSRSRGVGVRVLGAKTWGFASTASLDEAAVMAAALRAVKLAEASSRITEHAAPFPLAEARRGTYATKLAVDPRRVSIEDKLAALDVPLGTLMKGKSEVKSAEARMEWRALEKRLLTKEGTDVTQSFVLGACGMRAVAVSDTGDAETRMEVSAVDPNVVEWPGEAKVRVRSIPCTTALVSLDRGSTQPRTPVVRRYFNSSTCF